MPIHDWMRVDAGIFHHFHLGWMDDLSRVLNQGVLPADYYALAEQVSGGLHPDVLTLSRDLPNTPATPGNGASSGASNGAIALPVAPPQVRFIATADSDAYALKRRRIAIRHVSGDRVVAVLEIVSPGN
jgi:hypothetical protein